MSCLDDEGLKEIDDLMDYYLENAKILKEVRERSEQYSGARFLESLLLKYRS